MVCDPPKFLEEESVLQPEVFKPTISTYDPETEIVTNDIKEIVTNVFREQKCRKILSEINWWIVWYRKMSTNSKSQLKKLFPGQYEKKPEHPNKVIIFKKIKYILVFYYKFYL